MPSVRMGRAGVRGGFQPISEVTSDELRIKEKGGGCKR